jgi:hypothetical protein
MKAIVFGHGSSIKCGIEATRTITAANEARTDTKNDCLKTSSKRPSVALLTNFLIFIDYNILRFFTNL